MIELYRKITASGYWIVLLIAAFIGQITCIYVQLCYSFTLAEGLSRTKLVPQFQMIGSQQFNFPYVFASLFISGIIEKSDCETVKGQATPAGFVAIIVEAGKRSTFLKGFLCHCAYGFLYGTTD